MSALGDTFSKVRNTLAAGTITAATAFSPAAAQDAVPASATQQQDFEIVVQYTEALEQDIEAFRILTEELGIAATYVRNDDLADCAAATFVDGQLLASYSENGAYQVLLADLDRFFDPNSRDLIFSENCGIDPNIRLASLG